MVMLSTFKCLGEHVVHAPDLEGLQLDAHAIAGSPCCLPACRASCVGVPLAEQPHLAGWQPGLAGL